MSATIMWVLRTNSVWMSHQRFPGSISDWTYIEDVEDPIEVRLPGSDLLSIVLREEESRDHISSTLLDNLPLNLGHSSGVED